MGEMAEFFMESQDSFDFCEEAAMCGYRIPDEYRYLPTFEELCEGIRDLNAITIKF